MGTHVGALGLTLVAYWYARTRAGNDAFSFGTGKVYALAGYTSGVLLALVALWLAVEGVEHLIEHADGRLQRGAADRGARPRREPRVGAAARHAAITTGTARARPRARSRPRSRSRPRRTTTITHDTRRQARSRHARLQPARRVHPHPRRRDDVGARDRRARRSASSPGLWFFDPLMGLVGGAVITWWAVSLCRQASRQLLDVVSSPRARGRRARAARGDRRRAGRRPPRVGARAGPPQLHRLARHRDAARRSTYYRDAVLDALAGRAPDDRDPPVRAAARRRARSQVAHATSTDARSFAVPTCRLVAISRDLRVGPIRLLCDRAP